MDSVLLDFSLVQLPSPLWLNGIFSSVFTSSVGGHMGFLMLGSHMSFSCWVGFLCWVDTWVSPVTTLAEIITEEEEADTFLCVCWGVGGEVNF